MFATQNACFKHPPLQTVDKILDIKGNLLTMHPVSGSALSLNIIQENNLFNSLDELS